jgi:hypothetical protein
LTIASGAKLAGTGTIGHATSISSGGSAAPGDYDVIGKLSTTASFTLTSGATIQLEINGSGGGIGTAGTDFDQIALSGSGVSFTAGGSTLVVIPKSNAVVGQKYRIINATASASVNLASIFANLPEDTPYDQGQAIHYKLNYVSGGVDLTFTSVPEPAALSLVSTCLAALLRRRRQNRQAR